MHHPFNLTCELDRWLPFQNPKGKPEIDFLRLMACFNKISSYRMEIYQYL